MEYLGWLLVGLLAGSGITFAVSRWLQRLRHTADGHTLVSRLLRNHFRPVALDDTTISEWKFPYRVRADLQRAIDRLFGEEAQVIHFCGVRKEFSPDGVTLSGCIVESAHHPTVSVPPEYEEIDIGEEEPVRVLKNGLWLLEKKGVRFAVLLSPARHYGEVTGMQFEVGAPNSADGTRITQEFFKSAEESVLEAESYRGKILSLEQQEQSYSGQSSGITVHQLRTVEREQVILPGSTKCYSAVAH